jgi:PGF-CTERM protein
MKLMTEDSTPGQKPRLKYGWIRRHPMNRALTLLPATTSDDSGDESEDTPGFVVVSTLVAVVAALALMGRQGRND